MISKHPARDLTSYFTSVKVTDAIITTSVVITAIKLSIPHSSWWGISTITAFIRSYCFDFVRPGSFLVDLNRKMQSMTRIPTYHWVAQTSV